MQRKCARRESPDITKQQQRRCTFFTGYFLLLPPHNTYTYEVAKLILYYIVVFNDFGFHAMGKYNVPDQRLFEDIILV